MKNTTTKDLEISNNHRLIFNEVSRAPDGRLSETEHLAADISDDLNNLRDFCENEYGTQIRTCDNENLKGFLDVVDEQEYARLEAFGYAPQLVTIIHRKTGKELDAIRLNSVNSTTHDYFLNGQKGAVPPNVPFDIIYEGERDIRFILYENNAGIDVIAADQNGTETVYSARLKQ